MPWTSTVLSFLLLLTRPVILTALGYHEVKGPAEPVRASADQDVVLPCSVEPPVDGSTLTVEWRINDKMVHVYRNQRHDLNLQHEDFKSRTSLFKEELGNGNVSLKLSSVQKTDGGTYSCHVPGLTGPVKKVEVELVVEDNVSNTRESTSSPDGDAGKIERNSATTQTSVLILPLVLALATLLYTCRRRRRRPRPERREE